MLRASDPRDKLLRFALVLFAAASGCRQIDVVVKPENAPLQGDAAMPSADGGTCESTGGAASDAGEALFAAVRLTHAICACTGFDANAAIATDAFDGALGPFTQGGVGGDVGVNEGLALNGVAADLRGSLTVAGSGGVSLSFAAELLVGRDLAVGGPLQGTLATTRVGADAAVAGRIELGELDVAGELTQPAGAERSVGSESEIARSRSAAVEVTPPCACPPSATALDVGALVREAAPSAEPLPADAGLLPAGCARYVLSDGSAASLELGVTESAVLYVRGDLQIDGDLIIDTHDGAELDLFIEQNARIDGRIELGTKPGQGRVRVYVGGTGNIQLGGGGALHGVLYGPRSELVLIDDTPLDPPAANSLTVYGAVLVERVAASSPLVVHYDTSLIAAP